MANGQGTTREEGREGGQDLEHHRAGGRQAIKRQYWRDMGVMEALITQEG